MKKLYLILIILAFIIPKKVFTTDCSKQSITVKNIRHAKIIEAIDPHLIPSLQRIVIGYCVSFEDIYKLMQEVDCVDYSLSDDEIEVQKKLALSDINILITFISEEQDINFTNQDGSTLLMLATKLGLEEVVSHLCVLKTKFHKPIDTNIKDKFNQSALDYASHRCKDDPKKFGKIISYLRLMGATESTADVVLESIKADQIFKGQIKGKPIVKIKSESKKNEFDSDSE